MLPSLSIALLLGCSTSTTESTTWHRDVRPIVEASCLECHGPGGIGRVELTVEGHDAPAWGPLAVAAVEQGRMPPWPASTACHPIAHARALPPDDVQRFTAWAAGGFAVGDAADFVPRASDPIPAPEGEADTVLSMPLPQVPSEAFGGDDYRCVVVGGPFPDDLWVRASRIVPDRTEVVHHALAYLVDAEGAPAVAAAVDAEGGYTCFGGALPAGAAGAEATFATWVPGAVPEVLEPGRARVIPAGSVMVLQLHYNTLGLAGPPPADTTELRLWTQPDPPAEVVITESISDFDFLIPAGDPSWSTTIDVAYGIDAKVIGVQGHMHTRGVSLALEAIRPDGGSACVLDIPRWDFDWQMAYAFPADQPFLLGADDIARLSCTWDNSAGNQPVVDGQPLAPADVRYGERTTDEMCMVFASFVVPYVQTLGCEPMRACHGEACAPGDGACVAACWERALSPCGACIATGVLDCGVDACQIPGAALAECVEARCPDLALETCLATTCRDGLEDYLTCQDPNVRSGVCDAWIAGCEVPP